MANYNIYGHVLYSIIQYGNYSNQTKKVFIQSLMSKLPSIEQWTTQIWDSIDHEYMITTLEEIKKDVIRTDTSLMLKYKHTAIDLEQLVEISNKLENIFDINPIEKFQEYEIRNGIHIADRYEQILEDIDTSDMTQMTELIKNYDKEVNNWIKYDSIPPRYVNVDTYLSMLYNVNLTRTGWNQTFKDAEYFDNDLVLLETHRNACPLCLQAQGKVYSRTGKSKRYYSIEKAYEMGVGHPNCKCEFSIYWDKEQLKYQDLSRTTDEDYIKDQKKKAIEREIAKQENDLSLYNMIGNQAEADKTLQRINKLKEKI